MNIHHLELFYYVARHGGIAEAVRRMPYGIQQPAISAQVIQLEESLGTALFHRRPFELTQAGRDLFQFIEPFFGNLEGAAEKLRGGVSQHVRIGATQTVLRDYLPEVLLALRRRIPQLKVLLREGNQQGLEAMVRNGEIDLAVTPLDPRPPTGLKTTPLLKLSLVLLAPADTPLRSAAELWRRDRIEETLITLPANEAMVRVFQRELARRKVDWFTGIEVCSFDLVATYVASGFGLGLTLQIPGIPWRKTVRALSLEDFPGITFGILWQGRLTPAARTLADAMIARAKSLPSGV